MTDTTDRAPWCPRCGGEMVHKLPRVLANAGGPAVVGCEDCGFGDLDTKFATDMRAAAEARRLIRAELARQALAREMANYELGYEMARFDALSHYEWLGARPLRLPGEGAR